MEWIGDDIGTCEKIVSISNHPEIAKTSLAYIDQGEVCDTTFETNRHFYCAHFENISI